MKIMLPSLYGSNVNGTYARVTSHNVCVDNNNETNVTKTSQKSLGSKGY